MRRNDARRTPRLGSDLRLIPAVALAAGVAAILAAPASATQQKQQEAQPAIGQATATAQPVSQAAPATKAKLRKPTPTELEQLEWIRKVTDRSSKGLKVTTNKSGMRMIDLEDRFQTVAIARTTPEGGTEILCVTSAEEAAAFLGLELPAPEPELPTVAPSEEQ